jgi:hypothetical protein
MSGAKRHDARTSTPRVTARVMAGALAGNCTQHQHR